MTPEGILERLEALGVTVRVSNGGGAALVPGGRTPPELLAEARAHKAEVLALLERRERTWSADPSAMSWPRRVDEDPRPDLPGSDLWARLLLLAAGAGADDPHGVYGRVLGARACGAVLEWRGRGWRLRPTVDPTERESTWATEADWKSDAERWLRPSAREITRLLAQLPPPGALGGG